MSAEPHFTATLPIGRPAVLTPPPRPAMLYYNIWNRQGALAPAGLGQDQRELAENKGKKAIIAGAVRAGAAAWPVIRPYPCRRRACRSFSLGRIIPGVRAGYRSRSGPPSRPVRHLRHHRDGQYARQFGAAIAAGAAGRHTVASRLPFRSPCVRLPARRVSLPRATIVLTRTVVRSRSSRSAAMTGHSR